MSRSRSMAASTPEPRRSPSRPALPSWSPAARSSGTRPESPAASRPYAKRLSSKQDALKRAAAEKALDLVQDGMLLGLGSGSTAKYFTQGVGRLVAGGRTLRCVPSSRATAELAAELRIPIVQELLGA